VQSAVLRLHVVCPSVCLSVTLVDQDHIGWKSWKLIARTIRSSQPKRHPPTPRRTWGNFRETRGGVGKSGVLEHKTGNISETRKDRGNVTMEVLWEFTNALSNGTIPDSLRPPLSPLPKIVGSQHSPNVTQNFNRYHLRNGYTVKLWTSNLADTFTGSIKPIKNFGEEGTWAYPGTYQSL